MQSSLLCQQTAEEEKFAQEKICHAFCQRRNFEEQFNIILLEKIFDAKRGPNSRKTAKAIETKGKNR